jgi:hypothetical protein
MALGEGLELDGDSVTIWMSGAKELRKIKLRT